MTEQDHFPLGPVHGYFPPEDHGDHIILSRDFAFVDGELRVVVPVGFESDFNSVPRPLWAWFPPWEYPEAAIIHDWLYQHPGDLQRQHVDAIHRRIMEINGCRGSKRQAAYLGIRLGGWRPWGKYRKAERLAANA